MKSEEEQTIKDMMKKHFEDDTKSFEKIYELLRINGEHTSYFTNSLSLLKDTIDSLNESVNLQNKISIVNFEKIDAHIQRVEPMISSYEDNVSAGKVAKKWGGYAVLGGSVIGAGYVIKNFIINHLIK